MLVKRPLIVIPARYASTRFPGKPLALIHGKPMIQHVYQRCREACNQVVVATDDDRIASAVKGFGGEYIMTSPDHQSGTDRCAEAVASYASKADFNLVINVQGDEPFVEATQLEKIIACFDDPSCEIATLVAPISSSDVLFNSNKVKVVLSTKNYALYFSRQPIPFQRDVPSGEWLHTASYYLHIGMYAFKPEVLVAVTKLAPSMLEQSEKLEQLRWLENGFSIKTAITQNENTGIDTPDDLARICSMHIS